MIHGVSWISKHLQNHVKWYQSCQVVSIMSSGINHVKWCQFVSNTNQLVVILRYKILLARHDSRVSLK